VAHYTLLDENNIVTQVFVGRDEDDLPDSITSWEDYYGERHGQRCLRTSYNTSGNEHLLGGKPFRLNYAGIGFEYRDDLDGFIPPAPYASWVLNEETGLWEPPHPEPQIISEVTGEPICHDWDEATTSWVEVPSETV